MGEESPAVTVCGVWNLHVATDQWCDPIHEDYSPSWLFAHVCLGCLVSRNGDASYLQASDIVPPYPVCKNCFGQSDLFAKRDTPRPHQLVSATFYYRATLYGPLFEAMTTASLMRWPFYYRRSHWAAGVPLLPPRDAMSVLMHHFDDHAPVNVGEIDYWDWRQVGVTINVGRETFSTWGCCWADGIPQYRKTIGIGTGVMPRQNYPSLWAADVCWVYQDVKPWHQVHRPLKLCRMDRFPPVYTNTVRSIIEGLSPGFRARVRRWLEVVQSLQIHLLTMSTKIKANLRKLVHAKCVDLFAEMMEMQDELINEACNRICRCCNTKSQQSFLPGYEPEDPTKLVPRCTCNLKKNPWHYGCQAMSVYYQPWVVSSDNMENVLPSASQGLLQDPLAGDIFIEPRNQELLENYHTMHHSVHVADPRSYKPGHFLLTQMVQDCIAEEPKLQALDNGIWPLPLTKDGLAVMGMFTDAFNAYQCPLPSWMYERAMHFVELYRYSPPQFHEGTDNEEFIAKLHKGNIYQLLGPHEIVPSDPDFTCKCNWHWATQQHRLTRTIQMKIDTCDPGLTDHSYFGNADLEMHPTFASNVLEGRNHKKWLSRTLSNMSLDTRYQGMSLFVLRDLKFGLLTPGDAINTLQQEWLMGMKVDDAVEKGPKQWLPHIERMGMTTDEPHKPSMMIGMNWHTLTTDSWFKKSFYEQQWSYESVPPFLICDNWRSKWYGIKTPKITQDVQMPDVEFRLKHFATPEQGLGRYLRFPVTVRGNIWEPNTPMTRLKRRKQQALHPSPLARR